MKKIGGEAMALAARGLSPKPLRQEFDGLLGRHVNMRNIANFALGPYQKKIPAARKDEFYKLVQNYAAALFAWYADDFKGTEIKILSSVNQGAFVLVESSIGGKGIGGTNLKWRLQKTSSGYRVADVNVKSVWMAISMKKRFGDVLNKSKGDFSPLFAELREADGWWN